jgi:anti-sigma B factor antagonist
MSDRRTEVGMKAFEMEVSSGARGGGVLRLVGEFDIQAAGELRSALASLLATAPDPVVDLSAVTFMDSTAIHELMTSALSLDGRRMVLADPPRQLVRVLGILGITESVPQLVVRGGSGDDGQRRLTG